MRKLAAITLFLVLLLAACRPDRERAAVAQVPGGGVGAPRSTSPGRAADRRETRLRRLWAGEDFNFYASSPSPDGRYATEIDWTTGNLAVRDLSTGLLHHLTAKGSWEDSGDYAEVSLFSPDGDRVAYAWFNSSLTAEVTPGESYEIRVLDFRVGEDGIPVRSEGRVVAPAGPTLIYWLFGWSGGDELLVGLYRPDRTTALAMLSVSDGSLRVLRSFDWREPGAALSRDGNWIAYDLEPDARSVDRDIYVLSTAGGSETRLVDGPGDDRVMGWLRDGSLLFHSDRSGAPSFWRLDVENGEADGPPTLVHEDVRNVEPLGFADGSLYFGVVADRPRFQTARIDFETGTLVDLPVVFEPPTTGDIQGLAWSPDGAYVVHDVDGPTRTRIYVRDATGEIVQTSSFDFKMRRWLLHWAADGSVLLPATDSRGRSAFYRIDLQTFEATAIRRLAEHESDNSFYPSTDGKRLYFARGRMADERPVWGEADIVEVDLDTGSERVVGPVPGRGQVIPSPDGEWLAYRRRNAGREIEVFPIEGGEPRVVYRDGSGPIGLIGWTPDGRSLLFFRQPETGATQFELWRVAFESGEAQRLGRIETTLPALALHPDGRTVAYRTGLRRGEIWALDGLAADPKATADEEIPR